MQAIKDFEDLVRDDSIGEGDALPYGPIYEFENQNLSGDSASSNSMGWVVFYIHIMTLSARLPGLVPQLQELVHGSMDGD
jgi:hypothetical protein